LNAKISSVQHLDYWNRLKSLRLYSIERRRDRYALLYMYKIILNIVPNVVDDQGIAVTGVKNHRRVGRICEPARLNLRGPSSVLTLRQNSFVYRAPILFNALPCRLRNDTITVNCFKNALDKFLLDIPDEPRLDHYVGRATSNSLYDQLQLRRANGIYE